MLCVGAGLSGFSAGGDTVAIQKGHRRDRNMDTGAIYSMFTQGLLTLSSVEFLLFFTEGFHTGYSAGPYRRLRTEDTAAIYSLFAQGLLTLGSLAFAMVIPGKVLRI